MKQKGHFTRLLIADCETSGMFFGDDPSINSTTGEYCQPVSVGLIVVDANTLTPIDQLYLEIKWDGKSAWHVESERVHGLSREYLEQYGISTSDAIVEIGNLILKHWGPSTAINLAGHNPEFDKCFIRTLMRRESIELKFAHRMVDTNSIGFIVYNTFTSDELFNLVGLNRHDVHNALEDAAAALKIMRQTKTLFEQVLGE